MAILVALTPGRTAFILNLITDALAIIGMFGLVKCLNAYGRWKLYHFGKVNMNMHFHNMDFASALTNAFQIRRGSISVFVLLCLQALFGAVLLVLKATAPIGLSESKQYRVGRHHILEGEAVCRERGQTHAEGHFGEAFDRIKTHFNSGGGILRVGRTGKNSDALLLEDEEHSLGPTIVAHTVNLSIPIKVMVGSSPEIDIPYRSLYYQSSVPSDRVLISHSFKQVDYSESGVQITEGPLHVLFFVPRLIFEPFDTEIYSFARCDVPRLELEDNMSQRVMGNCSVAVLKRDVSGNGPWITVHPIASALRELEETFSDTKLSELGQRWIMMFDVANALSRGACGKSYVAYLPLSNISSTTFIILYTLGGIAIVSLVGAGTSLVLTRGTFDWNGSYQKVVNLVGNSDSWGLESCWNISDSPRANVVIEASNDSEENTSYTVRTIAKNSVSNPVPHADIRDLQMPFDKTAKS